MVKFALGTAFGGVVALKCVERWLLVTGVDRIENYANFLHKVESAVYGDERS